MNNLVISPSPHIHSGDSIEKNMYGVLIALIPAFICSVLFFGWNALVLTSTSVIACLIFEFLIQKYLLKKQTSIWDGSALITGVLLAFNVPSSLPVWIMILGALAAIGIGKMSFGGLGCNIFNPALVGRVFLLISFPVQMTTWPVAHTQIVEPTFPQTYVNVVSENSTDAISGATPLALLKIVVKNNTEISKAKAALTKADKELAEGTKTAAEVAELKTKLEQEIQAAQISQQKAKADLPTALELFVGQNPGSFGEVSALALLLGLLFMLARRVITWHIPITIFITVFVFAGILHLCNPEQFISPVYQLLSGGLMLGAIFMATDYVTSPMAVKGMIIYSVGIGLLTVIIRNFGAYPEGMSFAILIMNGFTPLINRYCKPKRFA